MTKNKKSTESEAQNRKKVLLEHVDLATAREDWEAYEQYVQNRRRKKRDVYRKSSKHGRA